MSADTQAASYILEQRMMPSLVSKLRLAMIAGALFVAAMAFIFPLLTGDNDPLVSGVFLGVAVLDLGLAVALPSVLTRSPPLTRYALYAARLDIVQGNPAAASARVLASIPYAQITGVEDAADTLAEKDRAAGFAAIALIFREHQPALAVMPYYDRKSPPRLILRGLKNDENPYARIKDMVEKNKSS
ncbi:MAG TPA: hypothetical protein PLX33_12615 [Alphaproteobacteria bacterium]|nr:hypothetical protein [Alphaproteobacteria bacterium]